MCDQRNADYRMAEAYVLSSDNQNDWPKELEYDGDGPFFVYSLFANHYLPILNARLFRCPSIVRKYLSKLV
jgi:hypothetical protein